MATTQKLDWQDRGMNALAELPGRWIGVSDGTIGHVAEMPANMTIDEALADYAAGYDAGDYSGNVEVDWELWENGEEAGRGCHAWEYPIH